MAYWGWTLLPNGGIFLTCQTEGAEYPICSFPNINEFEIFCRETIVFRDKVSVPEVFKEAFEN